MGSSSEGGVRRRSAVRARTQVPEALRAPLQLSSERLGFSLDLLHALTAARFVTPEVAPSGEARFGFQDLVLLRSAQALLSQQITVEKLRGALETLRARLPEGRPLSGVTLTVECGEVVVRDAGLKWTPDLGQAVLDFGGDAAPGRVEPVVAPKPVPVEAPPPSNVRSLFDESKVRRLSVLSPTASVEAIFEEACALEESQPERAMDRYRVVLHKAPDHADAHVNLGRLLQVRGQFQEAERHYRTALALTPKDATAAFNLGTALEDQSRWEDAIAAYAQAVALDPHCADAHYNLACLYEKTGRKAQAIRHLISARASRPQ